MKIDQIDVYLVRFPLSKPYFFSDRPLDYFDTLLMRMQGEGLSGWGEVFPGNEPTLTAAWSSAVFACVQDCLLPRLRAHPRIESGDQLGTLFQDIKGNRHAKALFDLAWWDLFSKSKKQSLPKALGGIEGKDIEVGLTFDRYPSPERFLEDIRRAVDDRFKRITMKIRPGWDIQALAAVRNEHPVHMIQCDVEGALSLERHGETLYRFDDFMISLLEQPLSASEYVGHAMLQDELRTTIGLDESLTTENQAEIALDLRSAGTFCLKPGKTGGLTPAKAIHDIARNGEIDCYVGADIMTSIGYRFVVALAALPGVGLPTDFVRFDEYLPEDPGTPLRPVLKPEPAGENAGNEPGKERLVLELWEEPGIGFEPDPDLIRRNALRHCRLQED